MNDTANAISPWVAGGLAGAILTLTTQWFRSWVDRPVLKVFFDRKMPGVLVRTPAQLKDQDLASIAGTLQQHYVRLKVKNAGRTAARGVVAYLVALKHAGTEGTTICFDDETLDLNVGLVGGTVVGVLPRGYHRFFDIAHVQEIKDVVTHHLMRPQLRFDCLIYDLDREHTKREFTWPLKTLIQQHYSPGGLGMARSKACRSSSEPCSRASLSAPVTAKVRKPGSVCHILFAGL